MSLRLLRSSARSAACLVLAALLTPGTPVWAQTGAHASGRSLPDAPQALPPGASATASPLTQQFALLQAQSMPQPQQPPPVAPAPPAMGEHGGPQQGGAQGNDALHTGPSHAVPPPSTPFGPRLTRSDAEKMALAHNPHVSVSRLLALAQHQVVRENRSVDYPQLGASLTAVDSIDASRIASGELNSSRLFTKAGGGMDFRQLITDFGRTSNLVGSAKLQEDAQKANALASQEDIILATDQAFYNALQAQALLQVANQTVNTRQTTQGQINQMTRNNLRSTLDLAIANVDLSQSQLLELDAKSNADAAMAALDEVLGLDHPVNYTLVDDTKSTPPPPADETTLQSLALKQRPDLQSLNYNQQAEQRFSRAQRDQLFPRISAVGTVGDTPVRVARYYTSGVDGAIGANISIPVFNGFLYTAQAKEAGLRAQAAGEQARVLQDRIVRDVHTAWLQAATDFQRITVSQQLLDQANLSLNLAQTRYKLGLSSIVELSQAQLQQTQAAISFTNSQYQYRLSLSVLNFQTGVAP
jgi:outer membrane protein